MPEARDDQVVLVKARNTLVVEVVHFFSQGTFVTFSPFQTPAIFQQYDPVKVLKRQRGINSN